MTWVGIQRVTCPRCRGYGEERDMPTGRLIVCRTCSGSGWAEEDDRDE